jgi:hypothetical protein
VLDATGARVGRFALRGMERSVGRGVPPVDPGKVNLS